MGIDECMGSNHVAPSSALIQRYRELMVGIIDYTILEDSHQLIFVFSSPLS